MKNENKYWQRWAIDIILVLCLAIIFDGLFLRQFSIEFHYDVQLTEIIGIVVTIILALYLAHVVEEYREQKKAKTEILTSILEGILSDIDSLSNQIYDSQLPYARLSSFTKMTSNKIQSIVGIMESLGIDNANINTSLSAIKNKLRYMRPILSSTQDKEENGEDYLVVSEGLVKDLSEKRLSKIQSNLSALRKQLYDIWLTIIVLT